MNDYFRCKSEAPANPVDCGYTKVGEEVTELKFSGEVDFEGKPLSIERTVKETLYRSYKTDAVPTIAYADNEFDHQYQENIFRILEEGESRTDRTGVNTVSLFGDISHKVDLRLGFPGTTLKGFAFKTMKVETNDWMLQGKFDLKTLKDKGVRIWDQNVKAGTEVYEGAELSWTERLKFCTLDQYASIFEWADEHFGVLMEGEEYNAEQAFAIEAKLNNWGVPDRALSDGYLGPIYGKQWRNWEDLRVVPGKILHGDNAEWSALQKRGFSYIDDLNGSSNILIGRAIDQVADLETCMKNRSDSRRIILTGWNVAQLDEMQLPPCHTLAQWYVSQKKDENGLQYLDCKMYQRSADYLLGVPFNIAQYAMITEMLAHVHGLRARFLYHTIGDAHLYQNHIDVDPKTGVSFVEEIMNRKIIHKSPTLKITGEYKSILDIPTDAITLEGYESYEAQKNVPIAK